MSGRPEELFSLFGRLESLDGLGPKLSKLLAKSGVATPKDLLFHLPFSVIDRELVQDIDLSALPRVKTLKIRILSHHKNRVKTQPYRIVCEAGSHSITLVFFHAKASWLEAQYPVGSERIVSGKLELFDQQIQMTHPDFVVEVGQERTIPRFEPIYPLTAGITQKTMHKANRSALRLVPNLKEWIDPSLIQEQGFPTWNEAIELAHHPQSEADLNPLNLARKRLAYDELFAQQVTLALARSRQRKRRGIASAPKGDLRKRLASLLPFEMTSAQSNAINEICADLALTTRMSRLLQGDVGAGKTIVALAAMLQVVEAGGQAVMMAPTGILAEQHFSGLVGLINSLGLNAEILTGQDKGMQRQDKLTALQRGKTNILFGTHAVFQEDVEFDDLRLAVIDEQHRFGVNHRKLLGEKGPATDVLLMTATPIPRSLSMAHYGDLDLSILDEKPAGRQPIDTKMIPDHRIDDVIERLRLAIEDGKQAYWVCPLVEESEIVDFMSASDRARELRVRLGEQNIGLLHGQMAKDEKDAAMADFIAAKTKILVSTTVIEVGVDVPNASIMIIERAERFGLSQLHQLRGRVGRGAQKSSCLLVYRDPLSETATKRLSVIRDTEDGFRISEEDLMLRGAGDFLGVQQAGMPQYKIADLEIHKGLLQTAHKDARRLLESDPDLKTDRGKAVKSLLYLLEKDQAIRLLDIG